jgi:hypothetical protein
MRYFKSFNEHNTVETLTRHHQIQAELSDRMLVFYNALCALQIFNIRKIKNHQHLICTVVIESERENKFEIYEDNDFTGNYVTIECSNSRNANPLELENVKGLFKYLVNNITFEIEDLPWIANEKDLWQLLISKDPSYKLECPTEYLTNSKLNAPKDIGVFDV